ncbi:VOC family protein [Actinoplanes rectilineatus]|uniref:VOC family protein n=1 Tax=Actinoplanes rectilineatus TaxID=113571 RepID=UPI0005F2AF24|nr:VOC family protein [Actinoplanes rectilineatus]
MTSFISHTTVNATDAYALSEWWRQLLDYVDDPADPNEPGHEECLIMSRDGRHKVLFIEVAEPKGAEWNRLHFDLRPADGTRDAEVERVIGLGGKPVADLRQPDGTGWVVFQDPEGNEFCVLRSEEELKRTR